MAVVKDSTAAAVPDLPAVVPPADQAAG
jgi:hypothetical protein